MTFKSIVPKITAELKDCHGATWEPSEAAGPSSSLPLGPTSVAFRDWTVAPEALLTLFLLSI